MSTTLLPHRRSLSPGKAPRSILARSVSLLLAPLAFSLSIAALSPHASATVFFSKTGSILTDQLGATNDISSLTTTTSGSAIQMTGTGFTTQTFSGITQINVDFNSAGQILTLFSNNFSFTPPITILTGGGAANDDVVKNGANTVTLTGSSTYAGGTFIDGGTLIFKSSTALGTGTVTIGSGAELRGTGTETLANAITITTGESGVVSTNGTLTLSGEISAGANSDLVFGSSGNAGTIVIASTMAAMDPASSIDVAFGTVRNGGGLSLLTSSSSSTNIHAGATLSLNDIGATVADLLGAGSVTLGTKATTTLALGNGNFSGIISGAGNLTTKTNAIVTLTGANTYTGGTYIVANSTVNIGNGGATGSIVGNVIDNGTLTFNRNNALTYAGVISGTGLLKQTGSGVLTLTGNNTYSNGTEIIGGVIVIGNSQALGTGTIGFFGTGTELRGSGTEILSNAIDSLTGVSADISTTGTLTLTGTLAVGMASGLTFGSAGHAGTIIVNPTTAAVNNASSIDIAFGTVRNGGNLSMITNSMPPTNVHAGATLSLNDINTTISDLQGAGSVTLGTKATTILQLGAGNFSGVISGAGSVTTTAGTVMMLRGANTYTGGTNIVATSGLQVIGSIVGNVLDNGGLAFIQPTALTYAGIISGGGQLNVGGTGPLNLNGNNTYSGGTTIDGSVVTINNAHALGSGPVNLHSGAVLRGSGTIDLGNQLAVASNATETISSLGTFSLDSLVTNASSKVIFGSTGAAGVVALTGVGTNTCATTSTLEVAFGTLRDAGGLNTFTSAATTTTVDTGATLALGPANLTIKSLRGEGKVTLGTSPATTLTAGGSFDGVISGSGQVTSSSSLILTGANTYTGGTNIPSMATVQVGAIGTTGSIVGNVTNNGTLIFARTDNVTFAGKISGSGLVDQAGDGGVLSLTGANTYTGGTDIAQGVLSINSAGAVGTGPINMFPGGELRGSGTITLTNNLNFASSGNSTVSTSGTLTLTTALLGTGTENVVFGSTGNAGTVVINPLTNSSITSSATLEVAHGTLRNGGGLSTLTNAAGSTTVDAGATLSLNDIGISVSYLLGTGGVTLGTNSTTTLAVSAGIFGGVISGAGQVTSSGVLTLTGANTYTGGTTITTGLMEIGNGGTTGSITGNVNNNSTLLFDRSNAVTFAGKISGSGLVDQSGTGVLTLTGINTYTGNTAVASGVLEINNASALGTGSVTVQNGAELRGMGTIFLTNEFEMGANSTATISTNGTLSIKDLQLTNVNEHLVFGSTGNAGIVALPGGPSAVVASDSLEVAFGTLRNDGGLGFYSSSAQSTTVDAGATLNINDINTGVKNLLGAGKVTLGTKAATQFSVAAGNFSGVISGAGKFIMVGSSSLTLSGASTYTGGTDLTSGRTIVNNTTGSATGTGPVSIDSGAILGGKGTISGAMTLNNGGTIEPGVGSPGVAGSKLHGSSLLWDGDSTLTFQIGLNADQLLLTGALTKGTTGMFYIDILDAGIAGGNYTLMTFGSTNFSLSDFTLELPANFNGMLVKTSTSLVLEDLVHSELPAGGHEMASSVTETTQTMSMPTIDADPSVSSAIKNVPEPGSPILLLVSLGGFLAWRRRRR